MKSNLPLKLLGSLALTSLLAACGGSDGGSSAAPVVGENTVVVATVAADFSGSDIQLVELGSDVTVTSGVAGKDQSDFGAARFGEFFYHIGRFNIDEVHKHGFIAPGTPIYQYTTQANAEDPTGNAQRMAFVSNEKAYITQYRTQQVLIVNPSAQTEAEFIIGSLDLSAYADADANGAPEASAAMIVDGKLFVVLQRLVNYSPAEDGVSAYVAVFDTATDTEIDTNPNDAPSVPKGIELSTRNPGKLVYRDGVGLFLQSIGDAYASSRNGRTPGYTGGISKIDTETYSVELIVDDGDNDNHPYGFISNLAIVDANNGYFVGYEGWMNTSLYHFNPSTGAATAVTAYANIDMRTIEADAAGNLWIGIADSASPRIEVLDGQQSLLRTINLIQNPTEILFSKMQ